jgi:hypothetical protein
MVFQHRDDRVDKGRPLRGAWGPPRIEGPFLSNEFIVSKADNVEREVNHGEP